MNPIDNYDAFWQKLKQTEKAYAYLSLDPGRRLWIDTYPPFMLFDPPDAMPVDHRRQTPLEAISSACRHEPFSLYFHIGFCRQRCAYCRQYEVEVLGKGQNPGLLERYVDQLKRDVDRSLELFPYLDRQTFGMYFGGGTPSILSLRQLEKLLSHLRSIFDRRELTPGSTFEVNPMHVNPDAFALLKAFGIPRISIGIQSFQTEVLAAAGRQQHPRQLSRVLDGAAQGGFATVNVDLINGFPPHADFGVWKREVTALEQLFESGRINSATVYMLHYFPRTRLKHDAGDAYWQVRNMVYARERLCSFQGLSEGPVHWFHRWPSAPTEIGSPSLSVFGYGNSSYSYLGRWLLRNAVSLETFLGKRADTPHTRGLPVQTIYRLTDNQKMVADLLQGFRQGRFRIPFPVQRRLGHRFEAILQRFCRDGLLTRDEDDYALTETGKIFANELPYYFFDATVRRHLFAYLDRRFRR